MSECDYCRHVEMCSWRESLKERGCDFFDYGNKWIPVSEMLPEDGEDVLVWYEYFRYGYNCMYQTYGIGHQYNGYWGGSVDGTKARCIAWMPLPEPYKAEGSEE